MTEIQKTSEPKYVWYIDQEITYMYYTKTY